MVFRKGRSCITTLIRKRKRKYKRRTRTQPHLCIFKQPSTLVVAVNSLLLSFERKSESVLWAEIQGKRKKPIGEESIIGCPIRIRTSGRQRSLIKGEWIFLNA
eukprot:TRINITY_DN15285_c0_g1_i1.p1 TRINITY_DN15285_c0_g1~~TRINITY_DN15285_c0_g1_i1.p1  ORF type:complete len:103 (-),score=5.89 TRINITY_DN15285_c0_g1_i1:408-716(-)